MLLLVGENGNRIEIERTKNSALFSGRKISTSRYPSNRETRNGFSGLENNKAAQSALLRDRVEGNGKLQRRRVEKSLYREILHSGIAIINRE